MNYKSLSDPEFIKGAAAIIVAWLTGPLQTVLDSSVIKQFITPENIQSILMTNPQTLLMTIAVVYILRAVRKNHVFQEDFDVLKQRVDELLEGNNVQGPKS